MFFNFSEQLLFIEKTYTDPFLYINQITKIFDDKADNCTKYNTNTAHRQTPPQQTTLKRVDKTPSKAQKDNLMKLINTPAGTIHAIEDENTIKACGIPYARAKRFQAPYPIRLDAFEQPYIADQPAPAAPQKLRGTHSDIRQATLISEDCQNLSILAPTTADLKKPVMVYLHGGSYVVGSGDGKRYNAHKLVTEQNLIVVTVTYRLGILGFLGGTPQRPANLGLLDVREALRWIKENISSFGGDPNNITVFGQSAGADLATQLMITENVIEEGLLHRVIAQSAPLDMVNHKEKMPAAMLKKIAHIPENAPAETYAELSWKMISLNPLKFGLYPSMMPFGTQYGYYPLPAPEHVEQAWKKAAPHVQVLLGNNEREAAYFTPATQYLTSISNSQPLEKIIQKTTYDIYEKPAKTFAQRHQQAGGKATRYTLKVGHPLHRLRSAHGAELSLLFDNPAWENSKMLAGMHHYERTQQGKALRTIWAEFARTGTIRAELKDLAQIQFFFEEK